MLSIVGRQGYRKLVLVFSGTGKPVPENKTKSTLTRLKTAKPAASGPANDGATLRAARPEPVPSLEAVVCTQRLRTAQPALSTDTERVNSATTASTAGAPSPNTSAEAVEGPRPARTEAVVCLWVFSSARFHAHANPAVEACGGPAQQAQEGPS